MLIIVKHDVNSEIYLHMKFLVGFLPPKYRNKLEEGWGRQWLLPQAGAYPTSPDFVVSLVANLWYEVLNCALKATKVLCVIIKHKQTRLLRHWSQEIQNSLCVRLGILVFGRKYCLFLILFVSFNRFNL